MKRLAVPLRNLSFLTAIFFGCGCMQSKRGSSTVVEPAQVVFGWRLALGEQFTYALTTRLTSGENETVRQEHWTYSVRDVDEFGVFTLRGIMSAFGVNSRLNGVETTPSNMQAATALELERLSQLEVTMGLSINGGVSWSEGLEWADNLPHTLLGLPLPERAVAPGSMWSDPSGLRPLSGVFPDDLVVDIEEIHQFEGLIDVDGDLRATILTEGTVRSGELLVPVVRVEGRSEWSLSRGILMNRTWVVVLDDPERRWLESGRKLEITVARVE